MFIQGLQAEETAVLNAAYAICAAARTAPKGRGIDFIKTAVLTGEDKSAVAREMRRISSLMQVPFLTRDADNVDKSGAVVLVGVTEGTRGLGKICGLCGYEDCVACKDALGSCVYTTIDLGIAIGSAVSLAADLRLDNRVMFSVGKAAASLKLLGDCAVVMGIPLSVSGKSPFFDRR
ncbi:ferredoxin [Oscillospiraceae bacterium CM]|nr:ferredoxin [Oscillospiraceae bacterium CM]